MKLADFFLRNGDEKIAKDVAQKYFPNAWDSGFKYIFRSCKKFPDLCPARIKGSSETQVLYKWIRKYNIGFDSRISERVSNLPGTIADPIIDTIINSRFSHLSNKDLVLIKFAHRLSMSAENILGLLLEEFLAQHLINFKWYCAWGESIRSVDFCSENLDLLQVKNRSNSENSSSSRVRHGTSIVKWFRVNANNGAYMWDALNEQFNVNVFSEDKFRKFVKETLRKNPKALAVEADNPWQRPLF